MATPLGTFGPGIAIIRRTDITNGVIVNVGFVNELSFDLNASTKSLYGQNQFPLIAARSTVKAAGKFKAAVLSGLALNNVFIGQSFVGGGTAWTIDEANTVPGTPFTVTVAGAATFEADLGVRYTATGLPGQRVTAGAEAAGKYSVTESGANKGKYVFAAADTALAVKITYSTTVATGQNITVTNQPIGTTPTFRLDYYTNLNQPTAKPFVVRFYACIAGKYGFAAKLEDFNMPDFEFEFFDDGAGNLMNIMLPEVS